MAEQGGHPVLPRRCRSQAAWRRGVGLVVGVPSLRIKGLYLAVATLAAQFMLGFVFREWESVTGGVRGVERAAGRRCSASSWTAIRASTS